MNTTLQIALDFDETYTECPKMWDDIIQIMKRYSVDVRFVTYRHEHSEHGNDDIIAASTLNDIPIVFCNGKQKSTVHRADIWIDDSPLMIPSMDSIEAVVS